MLLYVLLREYIGVADGLFVCILKVIVCRVRIDIARFFLLHDAHRSAENGALFAVGFVRSNRYG